MSPTGGLEPDVLKHLSSSGQHILRPDSGDLCYHSQPLGDWENKEELSFASCHTAVSVNELGLYHPTHFSLSDSHLMPCP